MGNASVVDFGSGNTIILGGNRGGNPAMCLKVVPHGLPLGMVKKPIDHNSIDPTVFLTFSTKEGLEILTDALFKMLQMYDDLKVRPSTPVKYHEWVEAIKDGVL